MQKKILGTLAGLLAAGACTTALAQDGTLGKPAIFETGPAGSKTLITCENDQMPVMTEGPSEEILAGKETHYDNGILKCAAITEQVKDGEAGGSGSLSFTDGRKIEVVNCPKGTVPFVLELKSTTQPLTITRDPTKPLPTAYVALAPILVRCEESAFLASQPVGR